MPHIKPVAFLSGLYIPVLLLGLLLPRNKSVEIETAPMSLIRRLLQEILYLSGPAEVFLNFLLFIPFFFAILFLIPTLSRPWAAFISFSSSVAAELAQSQINGRISSWRDFLSNCVGIVIAMLCLSLFSQRKVSGSN